MKPEYLRIHCGSNQEGDLENCCAFVDLEGLKEILALMKDLKEQRPTSTILQGQSEFVFPDQPNDLRERTAVCHAIYDFTKPTTTLFQDHFGETLNFVYGLEERGEFEPTIYNGDLVLSFNFGGEEIEFSYRMGIKHCSTIVSTFSITEKQLTAIIEQWEALIQDDNEETEEILENQDDEKHYFCQYEANVYGFASESGLLDFLKEHANKDKKFSTNLEGVWWEDSRASWGNPEYEGEHPMKLNHFFVLEDEKE